MIGGSSDILLWSLALLLLKVISEVSNHSGGIENQLFVNL
jgi:hypothetical protein